MVSCIRSIHISSIKTRHKPVQLSFLEMEVMKYVRSPDSISHITSSSVDERKLLHVCYTCAVAFDCLATVT